MRTEISSIDGTSIHQAGGREEGRFRHWFEEGEGLKADGRRKAEAGGKGTYDQISIYPFMHPRKMLKGIP